MKVSIVIPCCGGSHWTSACLRSLANLRGDHEREIVVVDNASPDDTTNVARVAGARVVALPENLGFGGGVNAGVAAATGDALLILNNDTQAAPTMLAEMVRALESSRAIAAVAPTSNHVKGRARVNVGQLGATAHGRLAIEEELRSVPPIQDVDSLSGLCLLIPRETWNRVGGFDTRFGHGNFEDDDLSMRMRLDGGRLVIARRAFLHHEGHQTFDGLGLDYSEELRRRGRQFEDKWRQDPAGRAWLAWRNNELTRAGELIAPAQLAHPRWVDALRLRGIALGQRGDHIGAVASLRAYVHRCPHHTAARAELAVQEVRAGRTRDALQTLQFAHAQCAFDPESTLALHHQMALAFVDTNQPQLALSFLDDAPPEDADNDTLLNLRGVALLNLKRPDEAAQAFENAIARGNCQARSNLGIALWHQGRAEAAVSQWQQTLIENPDDSLARSHLQQVAQTLA